MTSEQTDLAKRAVACKGWRWMPGMLAWRTTHQGERVRVRLVSGVSYAAELLDPYVVKSSTEGKVIAASAHAVVDGWHRVEDLLPDLTDAATLGCLLALVRDAWGDPEAHLALGAVGWVLMSGESRVADVVYPSPAGRTEAEALVRALEAAP